MARRKHTEAPTQDKWERMGEHIEEAGAKKGLKGKRLQAYIYGGKRAKGWKPSGEKK